MTADDVPALSRDELIATVLAQSQQLKEQALELGVLSQHMDAQTLLLATRDERIAALEGQKAELDLKLQQALKELYGPSSEKKSKAPALPDATLLGIPATTEPSPPAAPPEQETITYQRAKRPPGKGHGRNPVSREIRTIERIIAAEPHERIGPNGEQLVVIGYETSERLDIILKEYIRLVTRREKLGLPDTREAVVTAAVPPCLIPKGKATDTFIHEIVVLKFLLGLPLYRQAMDMNLQGAQVADSWLVDCVRAAAEHYRLIAEAIRDQVLANRYLQADETPIRQQTDTSIKTAYFWVWLGGGQVHFHFGHGRSQEEVEKVLGIADDGSWERGALIGYLVIDGYAGYNRVFDSGQVKRVACWSHVRRKIHAWHKKDRNFAALLGVLFDAIQPAELARMG